MKIFSLFKIFLKNLEENVYFIKNLGEQIDNNDDLLDEANFHKI